MLQPRISHPLSPSSTTTLPSLIASLTALNLITHHHHPSLSLSPSHSQQTRHASHATQGRANGPSDSAGRRLGLKRSATQYVVPGNIIFRQRGTKWFPGENVGLGKDHTIYATVAGYVRYYRDPARHKDRKYIGVSLAKEGRESVLPTPENAVRRRRLGMVAGPIRSEGSAGRTGEVEAKTFLDQHVSENSKPATSQRVGSGFAPIMRPGEYRIANVELARQAEQNKVRVRPFDRKDRFYAWRVRTKKVKARKLARAGMGRGKGRKGAPQKKSRQPRK